MVNKITTPPTTSELIGKINELVDDKQETLVSGTNIKTINNTSILGSGNIDIQTGSSYTAGTGIDITNDVISTANPLRVEKTDGTKTYFYKIGINNNNRLFAEYGYDIAGGGTITKSLPTSYSFSGTDIDISYGSSSGEQEYIQTVSLSIGSNIARVSDIPTVNDSTITFTQGGTTKGTITLNQSSNQTIALDVGGADVEAFTAAEVQTIWESI